MGWRKILEEEHRVVLEVVEAAEEEAEYARRTGHPRADVLKHMVEFFRYFNDGLHDPKEEGLLFARCHKRGMSIEEGPLERLLQDHEVCRTQLHELCSEMRRVCAADGGPSIECAQHMAAYAELVRRHIRVEEARFFDLAQAYLTPEDRLELSAEFESARFDEAEAGVLQHFEAMGHQLAHHD